MTAEYASSKTSTLEIRRLIIATANHLNHIETDLAAGYGHNHPNAADHIQWSKATIRAHCERLARRYGENFTTITRRKLSRTFRTSAFRLAYPSQR